MSVVCHQCHSDFETYTELAQHIISKKNHRKGRKWASSLLLKVNQLNKKKDFENRTPLTEEEKETRREIRQQTQLSGARKMVNTLCPQCKRHSAQSIEVEYANSQQAWRTINGTLRILCMGCRRN
jgi:uncharacterized protein YnzC (UPF0291/DUF896 family)